MKLRFSAKGLAVLLGGAAWLGASEDAARAALQEALSQGSAKVEAGDIPGAIAHYDAALEKLAAKPDILNARAEARFAGGDFAGADADFKRAILLTGNWPAPYLGRARTLLMQNNFAGAKAQLRTALTLKKDDVYGLYLLSVILIEERDYEQAIELLSGVTERGGENTGAFIWLALANAEVLSGDETGALIAFAKYQKQTPEIDVDGYRVRALLRYASADYDSCLLDVARVEQAGQNLADFRAAVSFARRDFATIATGLEAAAKQPGAAVADRLGAQVLRVAAGGGAGAPKPAALPPVSAVENTLWKPLYDYLAAKPAERGGLVAALVPRAAEGAKLEPEEVARFHLLAGIALESDGRAGDARRQYDLAWAQGGPPEGAAWLARQLKRGMR